jgi:hypothetical protein
MPWARAVSAAISPAGPPPMTIMEERVEDMHGQDVEDRAL